MKISWEGRLHCDLEGCEEHVEGTFSTEFVRHGWSVDMKYLKFRNDDAAHPWEVTSDSRVYCPEHASGKSWSAAQQGRG